jgi:hypothetical protein
MTTHGNQELVVRVDGSKSITQASNKSIQGLFRNSNHVVFSPHGLHQLIA